MAAEIVKKEYFTARTEIFSRMKSAWHADGFADPNMRLNVQRVKQRPLMKSVQPNDTRLK